MDPNVLIGNFNGFFNGNCFQAGCTANMVLNDNDIFGDFNGSFNGNGGTSANAEIEDNVIHGDFNASGNGNCGLFRIARPMRRLKTTPSRAKAMPATTAMATTTRAMP